ncbi:hypothetical protein ACWELJ_00440 [Nocardia sp. NPDC004582]
MPTPGCLDGQVAAVSVDGNMLVAADRNGWIYSMDNLLSGPMLWNWYGDMFTRKYDLDMAGSNHIPGRYTWQDQGPLPSAPDQLTERLDPAYAAISLPAEDWRPQAKIPGEITSRISIHVIGDAAENRELRVEGRHGGRTGYWHKDLRAETWEFTADDQPLRGDPVQNTAPDMSAQTLVAPTGRDYPVQLYTTDGLRLLPRAAGLDDNPRGLEGALDVREADPAGNPELAGFVDGPLTGKPVFEVTVRATRSQLTVAPLGATLNRG